MPNTSTPNDGSLTGCIFTAEALARLYDAVAQREGILADEHPVFSLERDRHRTRQNDARGLAEEYRGGADLRTLPAPGQGGFVGLDEIRAVAMRGAK